MKPGISLRTIWKLLLLFVVAALAATIVEATIRMRRLTDGIASVRAVSDIHYFDNQLEIYCDANGFFPTTEQGLHALVASPEIPPVPRRWRRLIEEVIKDDWGSDYVYRCPGIRHPDRYDLFSAGRDRRPDTADDVWEDWKADKQNNSSTQPLR